MQIQRVIVATANAGKFREIGYILDSLPFKLACLADFPEIGPLEEHGETFEENALAKARTAARETGLVALADDSGLVVDALDGAPGVYSARYAGPDADDASNNARLLKEMASVRGEARSARFECVACLCTPGGKHEFFHGQCRGRILEAPRGSGGVGYDPLFFVPELDRTFAELPPDVKNRISHRAKAFAKAKERLPFYLKNR